MPRNVRNGLHTVESLHTDHTHSTTDAQNLPPLPVGPGWRVSSVRLHPFSGRSREGGAIARVRWSATLARRVAWSPVPLVERIGGVSGSPSAAWRRVAVLVARLTRWRADRDAWQVPGDLSDGPVVVVRCGTAWYTSGHRVSTAQGARDVVRRVLRLPIAAGATAELRDGYARTVPVPDWALSARSRAEWEAEHGPDALDQWPDGAWWVVPVWSDGPTRVRVAHLAGQTGPRGRPGADPPVLRPFRPALWTDPPPLPPDDDNGSRDSPPGNAEILEE